jgi:hypothetical protein
MNKQAAMTVDTHHKQGIPIGRVEQRVHMPGSMYGAVTRDLFNAFDYVALYPDAIVGIQVTSGSNHAKHRTKILENPEIRTNVRQWLISGHGHSRAEIWSWAKKSPRNPDNSFVKNKDGTRKQKKWQCWIEPITLEMIETYEREHPEQPDSVPV